MSVRPVVVEGRIPGPDPADYVPPPHKRVVMRIGPLPDHIQLPYEDGVELFLSQQGFANEWAAIEQDFPGATLKREFFTLTVAQIEQLMHRATALSGPGCPDLKRIFYADTPQGRDPKIFLGRLAALSFVAEAAIESPRTPPPVNVYTQGYLDRRDVGIGATALQATGTPGARGEGTLFADVEQGWYVYDVPNDIPDLGTYLYHQDLIPPAGSAQQVIALPIWGGFSRAAIDHGTRTIGVIRSLDNSAGETGIAPAANGFLVSIYPEDETTDPRLERPARPDAIATAALYLGPGGVMVLEDQVSKEGKGDPKEQFWPVEVDTFAARDAIIAATMAYVTVIEATGNGEDTDAKGNAGTGDLDAQFPELDPTRAGFVDSGAILVAAATSGDPHKLLSDSRYGRRVDCYAWGENVATLDIPGTPPIGAVPLSTATVANYSGSSAATAIIAGAALVVQGMFLARFGFPASPAYIRDLLRDRTPGQNIDSADGYANDRIGVMPDLPTIANVLQAAAPDVYLRDNPADVGLPHNGPVSNSPDIIVRRSPVANPTAAFGPGSGHENDDALSELVRAGQDQSVYVRLINRGPIPAGPVNVNVYWSEPATLVTPQYWHHVGANPSVPSVVVPNVPADGLIKVSDEIVWRAADIPASGHYCFVALADTAGDPSPDPSLLSTWDTFLRFVMDNNNVTWRNFDVVDSAMMTQSLLFYIAGAEDVDVPMWLEILGEISPRSMMRIEAPKELTDLLPHPFGIPTDRLLRQLPSDPIRLAISLGGKVFPAGSRWPCRLHIEPPPASFPPAAGHTKGWLTIRQLAEHKGEKVEVGRLTWRFKG